MMRGATFTMIGLLATTIATAQTAGPASRPDATLKTTTRPVVGGVSPQAREFAAQKLKELDALRVTAEFQKQGFRRGSPHRAWYEALDAKRQDKSWSDTDRRGLERLRDLALEYAASSGQDSDKTRRLHEELEDFAKGRPILRTGGESFGPPPGPKPPEIKRGGK